MRAFVVAAETGKQLGLRNSRGGIARCFAAGRRSRRSPQQAAAVVPPKPLPPPGLRRLSLENSDIAAVLNTGRCEGPAAAHATLVKRGALDADPTQAACASLLQQLWQVLHKYDRESKAWEKEHTAWRERHAAWEAERAERERARLEACAAAKEVSQGSEQGGRAEDPPKVEEEEPMPLEPSRPGLSTYGCYIWGSVGSGKSLLMDLFVDCTRASLPCHRVHFHEFMHAIHCELHQLRRAGAEKTTQTVAKRISEEVRLLAFDEFQITNIADALIVETLFDALFQEGVAVVMTSNRPPNDLYKDGLNRHLAIPQFLALLERRAVAFQELSSPRDFRAAHSAALDLENAAGWRDFVCKPDVGCAAVEEHLRSAFAAAAGVASGEPATVPVAWGRQLDVTEASSGVGRFSFHQLCVEPLNADDYLHLARQFHTMVVTDVPRFTVEQHNEARRFTNLVDCLYERHARLILSADAAPHQLLETMADLAQVSLTDDGVKPRLELQGSTDWVRSNPFSPEPATVQEVTRSAGSVGARAVKAGDDDTATGAGVAGVMAGALGSLQESGFAAKRATSRLLHMQTEDYLQLHQRNRLRSE
eukprot:TRINITY_DN33247_c0_g1_i1.p1 TRINITY_DN33247_c0_g1~~TRINITY_DN33247_c0_g1_i1.p1  ORF type:complete len:598 (+),score=130.22 TRINITY_DN33247_c0_g1_i1:23-1795(+)